MATQRTDQPGDRTPDAPHDSHLIVTATDRHADVPLLLYGLRLRGIRADTRHAPGRPDPWQIVAQTPADAQRALAALDLIWDAVLDATHAITPENTCAFCAYDLSGVPRPQRRPCVCPECGVDLASVESRRAYLRGGPRPSLRRTRPKP